MSRVQRSIFRGQILKECENLLGLYSRVYPEQKADITIRRCPTKKRALQDFLIPRNLFVRTWLEVDLFPCKNERKTD